MTKTLLIAGTFLGTILMLPAITANATGLINVLSAETTSTETGIPVLKKKPTAHQDDQDDNDEDGENEGGGDDD